MEIKSRNIKNIIKLNKKSTKCPSCKKRSEDPFTPFCSNKCSNLDLAKWLTEEGFFKES